MIKIVEVFGLQVNLKLVPENIKEVTKEIKESLKNIPFGMGKGISRIAEGVKGGALGAGAGGEFVGMASGMGKMLGKLSIITGSILLIGEGMKRVVNTLKGTSPYLSGIFNIFKRSVQYFFRPFGDFLATMLRPLAIMLLRASAKWMAMTRDEGIIGKIEDFFSGEVNIGIWLVEHLDDFVIGLFDLGVWLGERLADFVAGAFNFGVWLGERLADFMVGAFNFGVWLGENIADFLMTTGEGIFNLGEWLGEHFMEFLMTTGEGIFNLGEWLGEKMGDFITGKFDLGAWIKNIFFGGGGRTPSLSEAPGYTGPGVYGKQAGGEIYETGLYNLHRGETVIPATRQVGGKTIIFKPTFSFPGATIKKDIDIDSMMRRASRLAEINLRSMIGI